LSYFETSTDEEDESCTAYLQPVSDNRAEIEIAGQTWAQQAANLSEWLQDEGPHLNKGPHTARFTRPNAEYRRGQVGDVERYCIRNYDDLHTIWLSLNARAKCSECGRWYHPVDHYEGFNSGAIAKALRRAIPSNEYVGVSLHSPRKEWYTHRHVALWIDGSATVGDFQSFIDSFIRNHPTAQASDNPYEGAIRINKVTHDDLSYSPKGANIEAEVKRGRTTALPVEITKNLPAINFTNDLQQAPRNVRMWAGALHAHEKQAWRGLGGYSGSRFKKYAKRQKETRKE